MVDFKGSFVYLHHVPNTCNQWQSGREMPPLFCSIYKIDFPEDGTLAGSQALRVCVSLDI